LKLLEHCAAFRTLRRLHKPPKRCPGQRTRQSDRFGNPPKSASTLQRFPNCRNCRPAARRMVWRLVAGLQDINCRRRKGRREMGGRGRDAAHMARARAKRAPFTDARDGRIKSQIRFAFFLSRGKPLTTSQLLKSCYCTVPIFGEKFQSWHRTNVCRAADQVAVRLGRASSRGRPVLWGPRPELMQQWRWRGLKRGSGDA
jgi:hypothetical protein